MSFYDNAKCPVCNKQLGEDDIVVTCPVCGTPHHRECYNENGHCANEHLHGTGYDYVDQQRENKTVEVNVAPKPAKEEDEEPIVPQMPFAPISANTVATSFDDDTDTICGKSVAEVAVSVGVNAHKFINTFKALDKGKKKFEWNWCAFFFSSLYFAFRKMYAKAIAIVCVEMAAYFASSACLLKYAPQTMAAMQDLITLSSDESNQQAFYALYEKIPFLSDYPVAATISFALVGAMVLIHLICGLIANKAYLKHIITKIDKVEEMIKDGTQLTMPVMFSTERPPTADDLKKMQLARKGGVSMFAPPLFIYCVLQLLSVATYYLF